MAFAAASARAIGKIGKIRQTLGRLAEVPRRAAVIAAPQLTKLLRQQFAEGVDPYGRAWAPLSAATLAKGRRPPPLTATRALRRGTRASVLRANYAGIHLSLGAPYGYFHQVGFRVGRRRVPARRILPQTGVPSAWRAVVQAAIQKAARRAKGGR